MADDSFKFKLSNCSTSFPAESTITTWLKEVGDTNEEDEPIDEIATDKVDSEVPAPVSGVLVEKKYNEGDVVQVGAVFAIIGAEYLLQLLPKGTHDYGKFIRPSELCNWVRECGLELQTMTGMTYNPLTKHYRLDDQDVDVNYLVYARKPD